jgi:hypothetical protein
MRTGRPFALIGTRASDPKVGTGFGKNPMLKQKDKSAGLILLRRLFLWAIRLP